MHPTIYKVTKIEKGTLSIMAKPVPGEWIEDEFSELKRLGIDKIVSLLERWEQREVGLAQEEALCLKNQMEFAAFPIKDRDIPNTRNALKFAKGLYTEICAGKHVVIHCRIGVGRAGIMAGTVLVLSGMTAKEAITLISTARGIQIPDTEEQKNWLSSIEKQHGRDPQTATKEKSAKWLEENNKALEAYNQRIEERGVFSHR